MADDATPPSDSATWLARHGDALFRHALVRVQRAELAEELVQATLVDAWIGRASYRGEGSELGWLRGILRHKIADHFRRLAQEAPDDAAGDTIDAVFDGAGRWARAPSAWDQGGEAVLAQMEFWNVLMRCLAALPPAQASVFVLREIDGATTEEVCKTLRISPTNMWVRLHRARLRLRHCLEAHWFGRAARS